MTTNFVACSTGMSAGLAPLDQLLWWANALKSAGENALTRAA
jgi:hypothetical protein